MGQLGYFYVLTVSVLVEALASHVATSVCRTTFKMAEGWPIPRAFVVMMLCVGAWAGYYSCPAPCSCSKRQEDLEIVDCNRKKLLVPPQDLPERTTHV